MAEYRKQYERTKIYKSLPAGGWLRSSVQNAVFN